MSCAYHIQHYDPHCEDCEHELDSLFNGLIPLLDAALAAGREPEPSVALAPAWATVRWPAHPSDVLKLLSETHVEK